MKKYSINWTAKPETDHTHTASTKYEAENFIIWKGKKRVFSVIYSANEWHLIRKSDGQELHFGKTAKECKCFLEYALKSGKDINTEICFNGYNFSGMKFDDEFNVIW